MVFVSTVILSTICLYVYMYMYVYIDIDIEMQSTLRLPLCRSL